MLCARVPGQLAGDPHIRKHDPNQALMAQGAANFVVPFFGGMPATGTIARTVTNLRAGAASPVAGIVAAQRCAASGGYYHHLRRQRHVSPRVPYANTACTSMHYLLFYR